MHPLLQKLRDRFADHLPMLRQRCNFEQATSVEVLVGPTTMVTVIANRELLDLVIPRAYCKLGWSNTYATQIRGNALTIAFGGKEALDYLLHDWTGKLGSEPPGRLRTVFNGSLAMSRQFVAEVPKPTHQLLVYVRAGMPVKVSVVE